jgi:hypothetical protein
MELVQFVVRNVLVNVEIVDFKFDYLIDYYLFFDIGLKSFYFLL